MSIKLGITGGIGSGKSMVSRLLKDMQVPVYLSDNEAKRLANEDEAIRRALTLLVGPNVYHADGTLNRQELANYLFANKTHARQVNAIIHPRVKEDFLHWAGRQTAPVVAFESAILFESGFRDAVDEVLMVYAPINVRLCRSIHRDKASETAIRARILQQMDDEEKRKLADREVINDGETPLLPQVEQLLRDLVS